MMKKGNIPELPRIREEDLGHIFGEDVGGIFRYKVASTVLHKGYSKYKAAKKFNISETAVNKIIKRFAKTGSIYSFFSQKRGPKGRYKLKEEIIGVIIEAKFEFPELGGYLLYKRIKEKIKVSVRSLYRALKIGKLQGKYAEPTIERFKYLVKEPQGMTSYGGSLILPYYYDKLGILEILSKCKIDFESQKFLLYYLHGKLLGIPTINNLYDLDDEGLKFMNGLSRRPSQGEIHSKLEKLGKYYDTFQALQLRRLKDERLIDITRVGLDPHFISYFGEEEEVGLNYDSIRRMMKPGYRPIYAYDLDKETCFYALWIKDRVRGYEKLIEVVDNISRHLRYGERIKEVYLDQEFYCFSDLYRLKVERGIDFVISARNSEKLKEFVKSIDGRSFGVYKKSKKKLVQVGLKEVPPKRYNRGYPLSLTLIGFKETNLENEKVRYFGYLSSLPREAYRPVEFARYAKSRQRQENYFKDSKHNQGHDKLPSSCEYQIKGHLAMELLGYNVIKALQSDFPRGEKLKRAGLRTLNYKLFQKIATIYKLSHRVVVEFNKYFNKQYLLERLNHKIKREPISLLNGRSLLFCFQGKRR
jgi:transposase